MTPTREFVLIEKNVLMELLEAAEGIEKGWGQNLTEPARRLAEARRKTWETLAGELGAGT